jgi:hypothetical protein
MSFKSPRCKAFSQKVEDIVWGALVGGILALWAFWIWMMVQA